MASRRMLHRQPGSRSWHKPPAGHREAPYAYHPSDVDLVVGLASPGAFPCPESSPSFNVQFSKKAGDGHLVAFGTEFGQLVIVDTRLEARVQRDHNGPVGWGQTDRTRTISSGAASTRRRLRRELELGGSAGSVGYCRSWGVRQPEVVARYRALVNCIFDVEWTHDDGRIALGCGDGKIRVHDTETHAELLVFCGHGGSVKTVAANPVDNDVILSGSRDGSFALWDTRSRQGQGNPEMGGLHRMTAMESSLLATAPANRVPTRYLAPVEQVYRANYGVLNQHRKRPRPLSFAGRDGTHPDALSLAFMGLPCNSSVTAVCWMKDGQKFLTAGQDGLVKLWDTRYAVRPLQAACPIDPSTPGRRSPRTTNSDAAACPPPPPPSPSSPPSSSLASLSSPTACGRAVPRSGDHHRRGGERGGKGRGLGGRVTGGEVVAEESYSGVGVSGGGRPYGVTSVDACDDGSRIAVCTVKNHISVYSYGSGSLRPRGTFTGSNNTSSYYIKAKLSPDGSLLASGATNDAVCLWQVDCPGPPAARLMGHVNEVTGLDFCRAEPLKLVTCSDDETVRVWTIDPLRVRRNSSSSSSSSSSTATPAAAAAGERHASGTHDRSATALSRGGGGSRSGGGGSGSAGIRGVSGWTPIPIPVPFSSAMASGGEVRGGAGSRGGGGGGGGGDDDGDDGDGRGSFVSQGKFGLGTARIGESSCWRRPAPGVGAPDGGGTGGRSAPGGGGAQRQAGGGKRQIENGSENSEGGGKSAMEVCPPSPSSSPLPRPRTQPKGGLASGLPCPRSGSDGGAVIFRPRSPNKKPGTSRTPPDADAGLAEAAIGVSAVFAAISAAARGAAPTRAGENEPPGHSRLQKGNGDGGLTGVIDACGRGGSDTGVDLELGRVGVGTGVGGVLADSSVGVPRKESRGLLEGLPSGWSVAKGAQAGGRGQLHQDGWQRKQRSGKEGGQEGGEGRRTQQNQKQQKSKKGSQRGGKGATGRGNPLTRDNPTLMEFWGKGQGGSSSGIQGQGKGPAGMGLERHSHGS